MSELRWIERDEPVPGEPLLFRTVKVLQYVVRGYMTTDFTEEGQWVSVAATEEWIDVPTVPT